MNITVNTQKVDSIEIPDKNPLIDTEKKDFSKARLPKAEATSPVDSKERRPQVREQEHERIIDEINDRILSVKKNPAVEGVFISENKF